MTGRPAQRFDRSQRGLPEFHVLHVVKGFPYFETRAVEEEFEFEFHGMESVLKPGFLLETRVAFLRERGQFLE